MRLKAIPLLVLALLLSVLLYQTSDAVERKTRALAQLNTQIISAQQQSHVLRAEWAMVTAPPRLEKLAQKYLKLAPAAPQQLATLADWRQHLQPALTGERDAKPALIRNIPASEILPDAELAIPPEDSPLQAPPPATPQTLVLAENTAPKSSANLSASLRHQQGAADLRVPSKPPATILANTSAGQMP